MLSDSLILPLRHGYSQRVFRLSTRVARYCRSVAYVVLLALVSLLPLPLAYRAARWIGRMMCALDATRRNASTAAIGARLGIDCAQAERITRRSFELRCCDDLESWLVPRLSKESLGWLIRFEGLDHLDAAMARGKGAVLYSGHMWGSRLGIIGLGLLGYRVVMVRRGRVAGKRVVAGRRWLFDRYRRTFETKLSGRILGSADGDSNTAMGPSAVSALRKNEIVSLKPDILLPQIWRPGDLEVSFLNGEETFRAGGALLARAADAPLLSYWVRRPASLLPSRCVIGPPVKVAGDVRVTVEDQAARMEAELRQDPACWSAWLLRSGRDLPGTRFTPRTS